MKYEDLHQTRAKNLLCIPEHLMDQAAVRFRETNFSWLPKTCAVAGPAAARAEVYKIADSLVSKNDKTTDINLCKLITEGALTGDQTVRALVTALVHKGANLQKHTRRFTSTKILDVSEEMMQELIFALGSLKAEGDLRHLVGLNPRARKSLCFMDSLPMFFCPSPTQDEASRNSSGNGTFQGL